ncbi:MAG: farnesyl diphosphate synthase [Desulfobacterales bacterium]|nr:farnesyl diphosphate synthase [Desulfobacterales bacterium]
MFELPLYLDLRRRQVDAALARIFEGLGDPGHLIDAMRYSLAAGGKRIRPVLCMAACEAIGGKPEAVLEPACALELIHTYSLIHDDLPAMDDDALRRGQPTCHVAFDEATAILAGDALLTLAFQVLAQPSADNQPAPEKRIAAIARIARAAGCRGMIEGQMRDIAAEGRPLALDRLAELHGLKTGALITAAVGSGALWGGGDEDQVRVLEDYGAKIGLAFQVTDDNLNVEGDPAELGKAVGTDAARSKTTYPALLGLERSKTLARDLVAEGLQTIAGFDTKADPLRAIARYIVSRRR